MMKKICILGNILLAGLAFGQVGINQNSPSATLDIVSKGNTSATKALEINNSSGTEMVTVLDNGNVGINVPNPTAKLHTNGNVRYENLPVISGGTIMPLAIKDDGAVGTYVPVPTRYLYMELPAATATASFPLADTNNYTNIPLTAAESVGHLPGYQSLEEVKKKDMTVDITQNSITNMEKIEELYLHVIELDKKIKSLEEKNGELEKLVLQVK